MRAGSALLFGVAVALFAAAAGCKTTVDSLGAGAAGGTGVPPLRPLTGPATYPSAFRDLLGKTDAEIAQKINGAFMQLFHGAPSDEAIYFPSGGDTAYIRDILHDDIRTEGIGIGMMVAVQLNARTEFDRLWRYAKKMMLQTSGPNAGYFLSRCDAPVPSAVCVDPFGHQMFTMALIFAHDRWTRAGAGTGGSAGSGGAAGGGGAGGMGGVTGAGGSAAVAVDYQADAQALLRVMLHKEEDAGGIFDGVINSFDATTKLVFEAPNESVGMVTRPQFEMPAFYALWEQATGNTFWGQAAAAARAHWKKVAHPMSGLVPQRANFDGTVPAGADIYGPVSYRTPFHIVLDRIWIGGDPWHVDECNRLLQFFVGKGIKEYGRIFSLDGGETVDPARDPSLVVTNGAAASIATVTQAQAFVAEVWNMPTPTGTARYYTGILDLMALLILGGQFRVY